MNLNHIRECIAYEISRDWIHIRWDAKIKDGEQFSVRNILKPEDGSIAAQRNKFMSDAVKALVEKIGIQETVELPMPKGMPVPEWDKLG